MGSWHFHKQQEEKVGTMNNRSEIRAEEKERNGELKSAGREKIREDKYINWTALPALQAILFVQNLPNKTWVYLVRASPFPANQAWDRSY